MRSRSESKNQHTAEDANGIDAAMIRSNPLNL
jgi:hypothetical protein